MVRDGQACWREMAGLLDVGMLRCVALRGMAVMLAYRASIWPAPGPSSLSEMLLCTCAAVIPVR